MNVDRRTFLKVTPSGALGAALSAYARPSARGFWSEPSPDYTIRIATGLVEVATNHVLTTTLYNGQFPGPILRLREGRPVVIDVFNETNRPEQIHWHGLIIPAEVDGATEEGTPPIPPHGHRRIEFTPRQSGLRFYHSHAFAGPDLQASLYSGQAGVIYIEPRNEPGRYDQQEFLVLKEFSPSLTRLEDIDRGFLLPDERDPELERIGQAADAASMAQGKPHGFEVEYADMTVNGRSLSFGEPIRVKASDRLLLHVVNASATETRSLALPHHTFRVLALDGNPVPRPADVPVLWLAPGERVSAEVQMSSPGVWVLGDVGEDRFRGMGIVVEYAGATGRPQWQDPPAWSWDYTMFGRPGPPAAAPDEVITMTFREENDALDGFTRWLINDTEFSMAAMNPRFRLRRGRRYRLRMRNASDDVHPIHLHRHVFEVTRIAGHAVNALLKDVVMVGRYQEVEVDFTANSPGLSLFHCHMQVHMDYGFMALFDCA
jgi:FtsP/CotA-like multicopper oxidase with cupredoxin domain